MRKRSLSLTELVCDRPEQIRVDFGDLNIVGTSPLQRAEMPYVAAAGPFAAAATSARPGVGEGLVDRMP